jgi:peroxiredoxin
MTSVPGQAPPTNWDTIPGAKGCTVQSCSFRDNHGDITKLGVTVYGLSTQTTRYQEEMATRLNLPYKILSDAHFDLIDAIRLPTFQVDGMQLVKRLTLIVDEGQIRHVFYPVFPPDKNPGQVLDWLRQNPKVQPPKAMPDLGNRGGHGMD